MQQEEKALLLPGGKTPMGSHLLLSTGAGVTAARQGTGSEHAEKSLSVRNLPGPVPLTSFRQVPPLANVVYNNSVYLPALSHLLLSNLTSTSRRGCKDLIRGAAGPSLSSKELPTQLGWGWLPGGRVQASW